MRYELRSWKGCILNFPKKFLVLLQLPAVAICGGLCTPWIVTFRHHWDFQ
jgi:hypothetical protein